MNYFIVDQFLVSFHSFNYHDSVKLLAWFLLPLAFDTYSTVRTTSLQIYHNSMQKKTFWFLNLVEHLRKAKDFF